MSTNWRPSKKPQRTDRKGEIVQRKESISGLRNSLIHRQMKSSLLTMLTSAHKSQDLMVVKGGDCYGVFVVGNGDVCTRQRAISAKLLERLDALDALDFEKWKCPMRIENNLTNQCYFHKKHLNVFVEWSKKKAWGLTFNVFPCCFFPEMRDTCPCFISTT